MKKVRKIDETRKERGDGEEMTARGKTRAGNKLVGAVAGLPVDFRGKTVLDIGSSTGGFTALALARGAARVIAVEKGTWQMRREIAMDPRVELHEKTDIFGVRVMGGMDETGVMGAVGAEVARGGDAVGAEVVGGDVGRTEVTYVKGPIDVVLADVSFVSLTKVLAHAKMELIGPQTVLFVMMKPQFEVGSWGLRKGVVKNNRVRREIIGGFEEWLRENGFVIRGKRDSEVAGRFGNRERFYLLGVV